MCLHFEGFPEKTVGLIQRCSRLKSRLRNQVGSVSREIYLTLVVVIVTLVGVVVIELWNGDFYRIDMEGSGARGRLDAVLQGLVEKSDNSER